MKQLFALLICAGLLFAVYKAHQRQLAKATEKAAVEARAEALRSRTTPRSAVIHGVSLSRPLEPLYFKLFSNLEPAQPEDLVPPLELTRERMLDKKGHVEPEKQAVYDLGAALVGSMIALAEERTNALASQLQARQNQGALETKNSLSSASGFFGQAASKKWEEQKQRGKPATDHLYARLRAAEREWNQRAGPKAPMDSYDLPELAPVTITAGPPSGPQNPLELSAHSQRRNVWRRTFYDQYGYPRTYSQ